MAEHCGLPKSALGQMGKTFGLSISRSNFFSRPNGVSSLTTLSEIPLDYEGQAPQWRTLIDHIVIGKDKMVHLHEYMNRAPKSPCHSASSLPVSSTSESWREKW